MVEEKDFAKVSTRRACNGCISGRKKFFKNRLFPILPSVLIAKETERGRSTEVICLMLSGEYGVILCDSDYAFIALQANFSFMKNTSETASREMLERVADLVNFGTLGQELPK